MKTVLTLKVINTTNTSRRMERIKLLRDVFNLGLKQAKGLSDTLNQYMEDEPFSLILNASQTANVLIRHWHNALSNDSYSIVIDSVEILTDDVLTIDIS